MMFVLYAAVGFLALFVMFIIGVGICEFFCEYRHERDALDQHKNLLHLKHIEHLNKGGQK